MDLLNELESMATNITDSNETNTHPSDEEISRWQTLFSYSQDDAIQQITNQRDNVTPRKVSDDHWDLVKSDKEGQGYSREAYEHWISIGGNVPRSFEVDTAVQSDATYLVLLSGILSTPGCVQKAANLSELPTVINAASEDEGTEFCMINGSGKQAITKWLYQSKSPFKPTFVHTSKAKKDLAACSIYPTLGLEATLPQHRQ